MFTVDHTYVLPKGGAYCYTSEQEYFCQKAFRCKIFLVFAGFSNLQFYAKLLNEFPPPKKKIQIFVVKTYLRNILARREPPLQPLKGEKGEKEGFS